MLHSGDGSNGLAVVVDSRTKLCRDTNTVLDLSNWRHFLGKKEWDCTLKLALRDYGTTPYGSKDLPTLQRDVHALLLERGIKCAIILQSPATPNVRQVHSAFSILGPGGSPYKWAGTVWRHEDAPWLIAPILHPANYEDVYEYLIRRWFRQAHAIASGTLTQMQWPVLHSDVNAETSNALRRITEASHPVAVDIETNLQRTIITAIGFSNGTDTVSIPWHGFRISGTEDDYEYPLRRYILGKQIEEMARKCLASATPKILHNGAFDVYELAQHGITLNAFAYDTLLLHRVAYPQFRRGLQAACATEFCVEPWKTQWKPPLAVRGTNQDIWLSDPEAMRIYNAKDAFCTWQLFQHLKGKVGL